MQAFDLEAVFGLVFMATGNLSLLVENRDVDDTFASVFKHLRPNGVFALEFEQLTALDWIKKNANQWVGSWFKGHTGSVYVHREMYRMIPEMQNVWESLLVIEKFTNGELAETEANHRMGRAFEVPEVTERLTEAGFVDIRVTNRLSDELADAEARTLSVKCSKPS